MAGRHSDSNRGLGYFVPQGDQGKPKAGAHTKARLGVAGPPSASRSIATGRLQTKRAQEEEAARRVGGYYDPAFDPAYNQGVADGGYGAYQDYAADAGYGYDQGYAYDQAPTYDPGYGYDAGYGYDQGYDQGYYGQDYYGQDYNPDDLDFENGQAWADPAWNPDAETSGPKKGLFGLFGKNRAPEPEPELPADWWALTSSNKLDAEAQARALSASVVDAYESGIPLGLAASSGYGAAYDSPDDADFSDDPGAGTEGKRRSGGGFAVPLPFGRKGGGVPSLNGLGVRVQVPTANMEKSLNRSADYSYQKRVDAGTGSRLAATMKGAAHRAVSGGNRMTYGADKELGKMFRRRIASILFILACILVAAAIGAAIGYFVSLNNRLDLDDKAAVEAALTEPKEGAPYFVLFAADLDDSDGSNDDLDAMLLARIDETNRKVTILAIPGNVELVLSDFDYHPATMARDDGGNARLITALSDLLEVEIAHYVQTDSKGLAAVIDALGGIDMTLTQEIDDPQAGYLYMPAGDYHLDGETALIVLRADNYHEGESTRGAIRCEFSKLLVQKILGGGFLSFANITDVIAGNVQTDYSASGILALARAMQGLTVEDVLSGVVPGDQETNEGVRVFSPSYTQLKVIMELMKAGVAPAVENNQGKNVNPANVSVTVWNGSGVLGGAGMLADILTEAGFNVEEVTNAKAFVYTETLIIYDDEDNLEAAYAVANALGQGRVLDGTWKYTFTTDILVVLGSEWK